MTISNILPVTTFDLLFYSISLIQFYFYFLSSSTFWWHVFKTCHVSTVYGVLNRGALYPRHILLDTVESSTLMNWTWYDEDMCPDLPCVCIVLGLVLLLPCYWKLTFDFAAWVHLHLPLHHNQFKNNQMMFSL